MRRKRYRPYEDDKISPFFGQVLRARRWDLGMSLQDVAREIGCSPRTVEYHERGATFLPRPSLFFGFAKALNLQAWEMHLSAYYAIPQRFKVRYLTALRSEDRKKIEFEVPAALAA